MGVQRKGGTKKEDPPIRIKGSQSEISTDTIKGIMEGQKTWLKIKLGKEEKRRQYFLRGLPSLDDVVIRKPTWG